MTPGEPLDERRVILDIIKETDMTESISNAEARRVNWENCWRDHASRPYFGDVVRWQGKFSRAPGFEQKQLLKMIEHLAAAHFGTVGRIAEFGCGAGDNLAHLASTGQWGLAGYDWAESAVERVKTLGFQAEKVDMFAPRVFAAGSLDGVLTVHAMEQLGPWWGNFFDMLLAARPKVCVHIEPLFELYDQNNLLDFLAMRYHEKRGYLRGFVPNLKACGNVEILELRRTHFGGMLHEAYGVVVWRPK